MDQEFCIDQPIIGWSQVHSFSMRVCGFISVKECDGLFLIIFILNEVIIWLRVMSRNFHILFWVSTGLPYLPSILASSICLNCVSSGLTHSAVLRGWHNFLGTTCPLILSTHWHISFPAPFADPRTFPSCSWLNGYLVFFSLK